MRSMLRQQAQAAPNARTLWEVESCACHLPVETATNLYLDIQNRLGNALRLGQQRRAQIRDAQSLLRFQAQTRERFLHCLGGMPKAEPNLAPRAMGMVDGGSYVIEKLLLQPRKSTWASAHLYRPAHAHAPCPAVLVTVGHDDRGKADPEYRYLAQLLASAGMIALVLDPVGQGERFEHYEQAMDLQPIQGCSGEHDLLDWKAKLLGVSLARYFVQDGLCALDYLASRPDVDETRIGLTGHSGGGTQACMLMLCAGERFACAAPCAYVTDARAMADCGVDPDNEMIWPGSLSHGLDYVDFLLGVAPKPLLILSNQNDFFPREGTLRTLEEAQALWRAAGGVCQPEMATAESQHAYPPSLAQAACRFFARNLLGRDAQEDIRRFVFSPGDESELRCVPGGQLLGYDPAMRTLQRELEDELNRLSAARGGISKEDLLTFLNMDALAAPAQPRVYAEGICAPYAYRCVLWRPQAGYWNAGVFLRSMRAGDKPLPTVVALWPEGLKRLADHSWWIYRAVQNGWQVLVMDVTGSGSLLPARIASTDLYISWSTMYILNAFLIQLGDSLPALRTRQVAAAVGMLGQWSEAAQTVCLYAEGEFGRYAQLASLLTGTPVYADGCFQPYEQIVSQPYHDQTHTHDWALPGALAHFDQAGLQALLAEGGLLADNPAKTPMLSHKAELQINAIAQGGNQP